MGQQPNCLSTVPTYKLIRLISIYTFEWIQSKPLLKGPGGASKVKHAQQSASREVNLSSMSYLKDGLKPGLDRTLRLFSGKDQHNPTRVFIISVVEVVFCILA